MARELICGQLNPDLACAIALGFVEAPQVTVTVECFTLADPHQRTSLTQTAWLGDDPLDAATREFLTARREAMLQGQKATRPGWMGTAAIRAREQASARAVQAKNRAWDLLRQRGVADHARLAGLTLVDHR
jgi:hypothetical protein